MNPLSLELSRGKRDKTPSILLCDYVTHSVVAPSPSSSTPSQSSPSGCPYPIAHYINCTNYSVNYQKFLVAVVSTTDPMSFKEVMKDPGWNDSMQDEIRALKDTGTLTLEELSPDKRALGS